MERDASTTVAKAHSSSSLMPLSVLLSKAHRIPVMAVPLERQSTRRQSESSHNANQYIHSSSAHGRGRGKALQEDANDVRGVVDTPQLCSPAEPITYFIAATLHYRIIRESLFHIHEAKLVLAQLYVFIELCCPLQCQPLVLVDSSGIQLY